MLELRSLRYQPATAEGPLLRRIDLTLDIGQPVLVAGRSGTGKSTLLDLIAGLARPSAGEMLWNGQPLNQRQRRALCGLVFQFPERHFLGLTVGQELKLGHRRLTAERAGQVLEQVGLQSLYLQQVPERLSGGQQRRLALAVPVLRQPRVLLLDEPTAGLDWSVRHEVLELLATLSRELALLVVTHEPELFEPWASRRWELVDGVLRPLHPAVRDQPIR
ncbi:MAG: ABC transporter ATP-binding protein [Cyanobacteriota bacterium]